MSTWREGFSPVPFRALFPDDLDQHTLASAAIELAVEDALPGAEEGGPVNKTNRQENKKVDFFIYLGICRLRLNSGFLRMSEVTHLNIRVFLWEAVCSRKLSVQCGNQ